MGATPSILKTGNSAVDRSLESIAAAVRSLGQPVIEAGHAVSNVTVGTSATPVPHGLARPLRGWFLVRKRGLANVADQQDSNPTPDRTLVLIASSTVSVDLWVY